MKIRRFFEKKQIFLIEFELKIIHWRQRTYFPVDNYPSETIKLQNHDNLIYQELDKI